MTNISTATNFTRTLTVPNFLIILAYSRIVSRITSKPSAGSATTLPGTLISASPSTLKSGSILFQTSNLLHLFYSSSSHKAKFSLSLRITPVLADV
eukprot:Awhi_evm5s5900